jgi:hypothetical protein
MERGKRLQAVKKVQHGVDRAPVKPPAPGAAARTNAQARHEKVMTQHEKVAGTEQLLERKKRLRRMHARDGIPNGLVEVPGPLTLDLKEEILNLARNQEEREKDRRPGARILKITSFQKGVAIETDGEKLAQHIADAIARSRKADVIRVFDDEGNRRILTCFLPENANGAVPKGSTTEKKTKRKAKSKKKAIS